MVIDDKLINYIENLSRLHLSDEEKEKSKEELSEILTYMNKLNELDTTNIEPVSHPFQFTNNLREDEVKPSFNKELIIKNAPIKNDNCFEVPKTVD